MGVAPLSRALIIFRLISLGVFTLDSGCDDRADRQPHRRLIGVCRRQPGRVSDDGRRARGVATTKLAVELTKDTAATGYDLVAPSTIEEMRRVVDYVCDTLPAAPQP
jgi:hypothetical protein